MAKKEMKASDMIVDALGKKKTPGIKGVRIVFMEDRKEFAVTLDLELVRMLRDAAETVIRAQEQIEGGAEETIPGYA